MSLQLKNGQLKELVEDDSKVPKSKSHVSGRGKVGLLIEVLGHGILKSLGFCVLGLLSGEIYHVKNTSQGRLGNTS